MSKLTERANPIGKLQDPGKTVANGCSLDFSSAERHHQTSFARTGGHLKWAHIHEGISTAVKAFLSSTIETEGVHVANRLRAAAPPGR